MNVIYFNVKEHKAQSGKRPKLQMIMQVRSKSYVVYYYYMSVSYLLQGNALKFSLAMYSNKNVECWKLSLCQDCLVPFLSFQKKTVCFTHMCWPFAERMSKWERGCVISTRNNEPVDEHVFIYFKFVLDVMLLVLCERKPMSAHLFCPYSSETPLCLHGIVYLTKQMFSFAWVWGLVLPLGLFLWQQREGKT